HPICLVDALLSRQFRVENGSRERLEIAALQNRFQLTDGLLEYSDPSVEPFKNIGLDRSRNVHVDHEDLLEPLAKPVESADTLFHLHRVPRKVVIDQHIAKLKVKALRTDLAEQKDVELTG